jgi:hypothetical protein
MSVRSIHAASFLQNFYETLFAIDFRQHVVVQFQMNVDIEGYRLAKLYGAQGTVLRDTSHLQDYA